MFSKQDIIASIATDHALIKHLHSKLTPEHLEYRPSEHQRSIKELLEYISRMTITMGTMLKEKAYNPEIAKEFRLTSESQNMITDFDAAMDAQFEFITDFINTATDEDMATEVDLFGTGMAMPIVMYFMNILFKNYSAYRMQLFHYMKDGLDMKHLNTANLRQGRDAQM